MNKAERALEYLMKFNKEAMKDAEGFIDKLEGTEKEYWKGQKFMAERNIATLQGFGISAKEMSN